MRNKNKQKNKHKYLKYIIILIIIVITILITKKYFFKDKIRGIWTIDQNTFYEFDGRSNGKLIVPSATYNFKYTLKKDELHIDFSNEKVNDAEYKIGIDNNILTITEIQNTDATYILTKRRHVTIRQFIGLRDVSLFFEKRNLQIKSF